MEHISKSLHELEVDILIRNLLNPNTKGTWLRYITRNAFKTLCTREEYLRKGHNTTPGALRASRALKMANLAYYTPVKELIRDLNDKNGLFWNHCDLIECQDGIIVLHFQNGRITAGYSKVGRGDFKCVYLNKQLTDPATLTPGIMPYYSIRLTPGYTVVAAADRANPNLLHYTDANGTPGFANLDEHPEAELVYGVEF